MVLVDSHCHLDFPEFVNHREEVLERAARAGISYFINIGTDRKSSEQAVKLSQAYPPVYATVGVHPHEAEKMSQEDLEAIEKLSAQEKVVAFGEVGLDFYYRHSPEDVQEKVFKEFLQMARRHSLPLVFHVRSAFERFFQCVEPLQDGSLKGVVHCFTGTLEEAKKVLDLGLHLSFTGILTFKKSEPLREIAKTVPLERMLLETDAPFLAPEGYRGKVNEPSFMRVTAEVLAGLKNVSLEKLADQTTQNTRALFGVPGGS